MIIYGLIAFKLSHIALSEPTQASLSLNLSTAMHLFGSSIFRVSISTCLNQHSGLISMAKFDIEKKNMCKAAITDSTDWQDKETKLLKTFQAWDTDGNGSISKEEMTRVLCELCSTTSSNVEEMMAEADFDKDGNIDYEEMVHWFCRAPYLEKYFQAAHDVFFTNIREMDKDFSNLEEIRDLIEGGVHDREERKKNLGKVMAVFSESAKIIQARIDTALTPLIKFTFDYHDKDNNGSLSYDESIIFFANFVALCDPYMDCISFMGASQGIEWGDDMIPKPKKLWEEFKTKYSRLKGWHLKNIDQHHKAAFELLSTEGRIQEADLIEALLPGHKKNNEFMEALGLAVILDERLEQQHLTEEEADAKVDAMTAELREMNAEMDRMEAKMTAEMGECPQQ